MFDFNTLDQGALVNPVKFKEIINIMKGINDKDILALDVVINNCNSTIKNLDVEIKSLRNANQALLLEFRTSMRKRNIFKPLEEQEKDSEKFLNIATGTHFLHIVLDTMFALRLAYVKIKEIASDLKPDHLYITRDTTGNSKWDSYGGDTYDSYEELQRFFMEANMNKPMVNKFVSAVLNLDNAPINVNNLLEDITSVLDNYQRFLNNRHSVEGIEIQKNAVLTDVALTIFSNTDAHGEIADGKNPDEISIYSVRKAHLLADSVKKGIVYDWIIEPDNFIKYLKDNFVLIDNVISSFIGGFKEIIGRIKMHMGSSNITEDNVSRHEFSAKLEMLKDVSPSNITYKDRGKLLTSEERFNLNFKNETLKEIASLIEDENSTPEVIIEYILQRKAELRKYFQEENSFYVCKIGTGNNFLGEPPGELIVVPGEKPSSSFEDIIGQGMDEVKEFLETVRSASKWHDLFVATSPSKTADKSNVLLVGPAGCGKSEIMRAVASEKDSIGIYAQASDFLTCWAGESQKNPKRLFEAGLKLKKETDKHVHFLLDEIDAVLNDDKEYGSKNLTLEFQTLMDGIVHYAGLSVWGTTNSPRRIPVPMIRRFSAVVIVGELEQSHRKHLLQLFLNYLPLKGFTDEVWDDASKRLEGATGDVIRKVCDDIWRKSISGFARSNSEKADELIKELNAESKFDVRQFDKGKRSIFKEKISEFVNVTPVNLADSLNIHLNNLAIQKEIESAVFTYKTAKDFLFQLDSGSR